MKRESPPDREPYTKNPCVRSDNDVELTTPPRHKDLLCMTDLKISNGCIRTAACSFVTIFAVFITSLSCVAAPFAQWFDMRQANGTIVRVWGEGNDFSAIFESEDGHTVKFHPNLNSYVYVTKDEATGALVLTDIIVGKETTELENIPLHLRDTSKALRDTIDGKIKEYQEANRESLERWENIKAQLRSRRESSLHSGEDRPILMQPPDHTTIGNIVGLTILIDFPVLDSYGNVKTTLRQQVHPSVTKEHLEQLINGDNCTLYGNASSVKAYYKDVSCGKLNYTNVVLGWFLAAHPREYYDDPNVSNGPSAIALIGEVLTQIKNDPDYETKYLPLLQTVTTNGNEFRALNVFYAGESAINWSKGLWSHTWYLNQYNNTHKTLLVNIGGVNRYFNHYQITHVSTKPSISTFCHENGHMICDFPDLYTYTTGSGRGSGNFSLMGGTTSLYNPGYIDPYLRAAAGWIEPKELPSGETTVTVSNDYNEVWRYTNPNDSSQYYLIENRQARGRDAQLPGSGIIIWRCDEKGNNTTSYSVSGFAGNAKYRLQNELSVEQADGLYQIERSVDQASYNNGDAFDLWYAGNTASLYKNIFNASSTPCAKWRDGSDAKLELRNFSENGSTMSFVAVVGDGMPDLRLSPTERMYQYVADEGEFLVIANSAWVATKSESWIELHTTSGSGNGKVQYSVLNNATSGDRMGFITVTCGSKTVTHKVIQYREQTKLGISPPSSDFSNIADSGSFSVVANYSWTITTSDSWIKLHTINGSGNGTALYSVEENTGSRRTGTITVTSGSLTAMHTVTQTAPPQLSIDPGAKTFSADAGGGTIAVTSDSMWTVSKSATWITLNNTEGNGNGTISYNVLENTGSQRQGWIYVKSGSVQRSFLVTQYRRATVTVSEESAHGPYDGGTGTFTVTILGNNRSIGVTASTVPWASWTWESANLTEGTRYTFSYNVLANTSIQQRTTKIPIYVYFNGTNYYFTITQGPLVNNFLVTYRPGAYGTGSETYDVKHMNVSLTLRGAIFTRTDGYEQTGWATSDGGGRVYDLGASYTANAAVTLYPYWTKKNVVEETYNIYLGPGSYGEGKEQTLIKTKGVALTLPGALYKRDGYEQTGWSQAISGASKAYDLGGKYTKDVMTYLYPYWTKVAEEEPSESDFGFYLPSGWKTPIYLCTTNTEWWTYAPQYVFSQGDSLRVNYCINNYSETQAVNVNSRLISLISSDGEAVTSLSESFEGDIQPLYRKHYRSANVNGWLSQCAPGNYSIKMTLDPFDELNDVDKSDNTALQWFAVKADGISYNEALDCRSLNFTDNGSSAFVQTSESVVGGSCVQFGPQPSNSVTSAMWAYVRGAGTLSFKWKAITDDYKACMVFYVGDEMKKYIWGGDNGWVDVDIEIGDGERWVRWELWSYDTSPASLTAGWLDNVVWNPTGQKPTFTVDGKGTLTGVELNGVTDLEIPSMVNLIAVRAIGYCVLTNTAITSLSIPNTVTNIEPFAFWRNGSLSGVTIPGSVAVIGENAFGGCKAIKSVQIEEGVKTIGNYAFYACDSLTTVGIPASVVDIRQSPFGECQGLQTITVANGNARYEIIDRALVDKTSMSLIQYPSGCAESQYFIPNGIASIGYDAFAAVTNLTKVTLPESLTSLDRFAFYMCSNLNELTFKGNAPSIGDYAFMGVASSCKAVVSPQSTGWGVSIPGTWQGIGIEYSAALQTYTVTYNPGANGAGNQQSETKHYGITLPLKSAIYKRTGHLQTGWATNDGGAKAYELGASYTANAAVTLYPFWTPNAYSVAYELDGGTAGSSVPASATYGTAFRVSAPTRNGFVFMGWMVTGGLDITTAKYGESADSLLTDIDNDGQQCFNGSDVDVWFINLTPVADGNVTLTATWEPVVDDSRDIGFYAPASKGWAFPVCLSSTNIDYLAYAPETEFMQFSDVYLSFCAVNWSTAGSALLQSTLLTVTDENGSIFDQGEPIQLASLGALGYKEIRNMSLRRYMSGITPGRYKLTLELDPNRLLVDPDRSNNITSIWFTVTAPTDPIPELPADATAADVRVALAGSADEQLAENISDVSTYTAYREWARAAKGANGSLVGVAAVKASDKAWFSFAIDSPKLIEKEIVSNDVKIEDFAVVANGGQFDFVVGIADVEIGDGATTERLKTVFGIEGATRLDNSVFSSDNITLETAASEHGKVKLTAKPAAPKTGEDSITSAFFMRVKVRE